MYKSTLRSQRSYVTTDIAISEKHLYEIECNKDKRTNSCQPNRQVATPYSILHLESALI